MSRQRHKGEWHLGLPKAKRASVADAPPPSPEDLDSQRSPGTRRAFRILGSGVGSWQESKDLRKLPHNYIPYVAAGQATGAAASSDLLGAIAEEYAGKLLRRANTESQLANLALSIAAGWATAEPGRLAGRELGLMAAKEFDPTLWDRINPWS